MITIAIPGRPELRLHHLVADFNGTLAQGGRLLPGVAERIETLAETIAIHVVTADTFGEARRELADLSVNLVVLTGEHHDEQKRHHIAQLGPSQAVAVGNGLNDRLMLTEAGLSLAVVQAEGAAGASVQAADVLFRDVLDALDSLLDPRRLVATLRP